MSMSAAAWRLGLVAVPLLLVACPSSPSPRREAPDASAEEPPGDAAVEAAPTDGGGDSAVAPVEVGPPVIGLSGYVILPGTRGDGGLGRYRVTRTYPLALRGAGAIPVHLLPVEGARVSQVLDRVDALVLCGGPDIDPAAYGEEQHESVELMPAERQDFDFALAREAMRRRMPILGICLGSQELNVVRGGDMVQDLPSEVGGDVDHRQTAVPRFRTGVHEIRIEPGTRLAEIYDAPTLRVNSAHHQAAERLGEGLRVAARSPDGVVEAFDDPSYPFLVGVQFHPEAQQDPAGQHDPLFAAFVEAATAYRRARLATSNP